MKDEILRFNYSEPITVLCYGDSNTYGYFPGQQIPRYPYSQRWTTLLQQQLSNQYQVIVEGLNGRTTAYDRPGFPWKNGYTYLFACLSSHRPIDYLIFMLGTNDCQKEMNLSVNEITSGMRKLIEDSKNFLLEGQGYLPKVILIAPAPIGSDFEGTMFEDDLDDTCVIKSHELVNQYRQLAIQQNCLFLDGSQFLEVSVLDCEHLTLCSQQKLAEAIYNIIQENID